MKLLLTAALSVSCAFAQGSGSVATPPSVNGSDAEPFQVTRSVTGVVKEISPEKLVIEDTKKKISLELKIAARVRVNGSVKALADILPGATVRVNYTNQKSALDIRVLAKGGHSYCIRIGHFLRICPSESDQ